MNADRKASQAGYANERFLCADLVRKEAVLLLVDLVESVRLMREHEASTVYRWMSFVRHVVDQILPLHRGTMIKNLGDGLMAHFATVFDAINAADAMHRLLAASNVGMPDDRHLMLRAAVNAATAWSDGGDFFGTGVNLTARLATLAGPGETIASDSAHEKFTADLASLARPGETIATAAARDDLTHEVEAVCEDLGECYLKHFDKPVRAYRIGKAGPRSPLPGRRQYGASTQPTFAVVPFTGRSNDPEYFDLGNLIADSVIWRLSQSAHVKVISRLSTAIFRDRTDDPAQVSAHLGANYIVCGSYVVNANSIIITAELCSIRDNQVVWSERMSGEVADLLQPASELADAIAKAVQLAVFDSEVRHILTHPLPTIASYSLLLASIRMMHRANKNDFFQTRSILEELINRHSRIAAPRAWLANWCVLRVTRGWSEDPKREAVEALNAARAALDLDPSDGHALATEGFVHCHLLRDLDTARQCCESSVNLNPSHALGWLYLGTIQAFEGEGDAAINATRRAIELSPLDPQRYYFDSLAATAELAARNYEIAEGHARASLLLNRMHPSTWRALTIALVSQGRVYEGRETMRKVRQLEPALTVERYRARIPNSQLETGRHWIRCLEEAGLPSGN